MYGSIFLLSSRDLIHSTGQFLKVSQNVIASSHIGCAAIQKNNKKML
ncbi:hypothetical protein [Rickettsia endosymbiont of Orchestes rusci]